MNSSTIQLPTTAPVSWTSSEAPRRDGEFLSLSLLNKSSRIRLSLRPPQPSNERTTCFVVANKQGWFAALTQAGPDEALENQLILSPLNDLRISIQSASEEEVGFSPKRTLLLTRGLPTYLAFAKDDTRLLVGYTDGAISIYDCQDLFTHGKHHLEPLRILEANGPGKIAQVLGNPGDLPGLVAIRREAPPGSPAVEIIDVDELQVVGAWLCGDVPASTPTALSWSFRGKQLVIGLASGDLATFSPYEAHSPKQIIPKPPSATSRQPISVLWLTNHFFYVVYVPEGRVTEESKQSHVLIHFDAKQNMGAETLFGELYYPSTKPRVPGAFFSVFRNWDPAKFLIFMADSNSSDMGVVGCLHEQAEESWVILDLDETSTPSMPLDSESEETVPMGLDIDRTYTVKNDKDPVDILPPVLYVYASDGTLQAWYVSNNLSGAYSSMIPTTAFGSPSTPPQLPTASKVSKTPSTSSANPVTTVETPEQVAEVTPAQAPVFGQAIPVSSSSTPSSVFGQPSAAPAFGAPAFGQPAAFGQQTTTPTFVQTSAPSSGGFGAFASQVPTKFGSTGFGFNTSSQQTSSFSAPTTSSVEAVASPEAEMDEANDEGLGGLSLGGESAPTDSSSKTASSIFGSFSQPSANPSNVFGSSAAQPGVQSSIVKPATGFGVGGAFGTGAFGTGAAKPVSGFGAFSNFSSTPATTNTSTDTAKSASSPAFGSSGFAQTPMFGQSSFGQTGFGSAPVFGQSAFGSSAATSGSNAFGNTKGSGFAAFASGPAAFGQSSQLQPPQPSKISEAPSITMSTSSEGEKASSGMESNSALETSTAAAANSSTSEQTTVVTPVAPVETSNSTPLKAPSVFGGASQPAQPVFGQNSFTTPSRPSNGEVGSSPEGSPKTQPNKADLLTSESPTGSAKQATSTPATTGQSTPVHNIFGTGTFGASSPSRTAGLNATGGAFSNLSSTPSGFKIPEGFGAFGSSASSSPFANKGSPAVTAFTPAKSVFGTASTPAVKNETISSPQSVFGSAPAFGKPSFGTPSTPISAFSSTPKSSPTAGGSAFSSYSGSGGFGSFAGAKPSSFSDLLKKETDKSLGATTTVAGEKVKEPAEAPQTDSSSKETEGSKLKGEPSFVKIPEQKPDEIAEEDLPPTPSTHGTFDEEERDADGRLGQDVDDFLSDDYSDGSADGRDDDDDDDDDDEEEEEEEENDTKEEEADGPSKLAQTPARSATTSPFALPSPVTPQQATPTPAKPASVFAPVTPKSPTQTPPQSLFSKAGPPFDQNKALPTPVSPIFGKAPLFKIPATGNAPLFGGKSSSAPFSFFGSPTTEGDSKKPVQASPASDFGQAPAAAKLPTPEVAEKTTTKTTSVFGKPVQLPQSLLSTTPPGSPEKGSESSSILSPKPVVPSSTSSLGLGKPSSRPTKSSPLAGAPVSSEPGQASASPALVKPRPASPKIPFGVFPDQKNLTNAQTSLFKGRDSVATIQVGPSSGLAASPQNPPSSQLKAPSSLTSSGLKTGLLPTSNLFGDRSVLPPQPGQRQVSMAATSSQPTFESALQEECQGLCLFIEKELETLKKIGADSNLFAQKQAKPTGFVHTKEDFGNQSRWAFGDLDVFTKLVKGLEEDIADLYEFKGFLANPMREIESNLLKAQTRREEIARFSKARDDPEFAKMLKARTLGPEAAETQNQLRKQVALIKERVEQLEELLQSWRKKIEEHRRGKQSMRAPSLDTINRTYRNIDIALERQTQSIADLTNRVSRLNLEATQAQQKLKSSGRRESPSPFLSRDSPSRLIRPEVTPSVAASTAAALNAERSALRLKNALAKVRTVPLLNTQAVQSAIPVPTLANIRRSSVSSSALLAGPDTPDGNWPSSSTSPDHEEQSSGSSPSPYDSRHSRTRLATHAKSVPLKRDGHTRVPSSITSFDWGPLPGAKPMANLPPDVRPNYDRRPS